MAQERLALIEIVERDGRVRQQLEVRGWPLTIGRSLDCDLVIEDPHVAAHHATLSADDDGRLWLAVGDTHNGVRVGGRQWRAGERVALEPTGDPLHLGLTRLRVRRAGDPIAAEKPLVGPLNPHTVAWTLVFTFALWAVLLGQHWVDSDPNTNLTNWLPALLGPPGALALWCGAWAMASKLFQHRFEFGVHWGHAVRWLLGLTLAGLVLSAGAAALGLPQLFRWVGVVEVALATGWLFGHARLVLPAHPRALAVSFAAALVGGLVVTMTLNHQREERLVGPLYMHLLPHPGLRLSRPQPPAAFIERAKGLRATLDLRARGEPDDDEPTGADDAGS